ncbi:MAG: SUMF1/EgtB/PvdO family nonheme iron enzyme [Anaerolineae bacterium]
MFQPSFKNVFEPLIKQLGITQKEIAAHLTRSLKGEKVTPSKISRWVTGEYKWPPNYLKETCEYLELDDKQTEELFKLAGLIRPKDQQTQERGQTSSSEAEYQAALNKYLQWLANDNGWIVLYGIERDETQKKDLPLNEVYLPLAARALPKSREQHGQTSLPGSSKAKDLTETSGSSKRIRLNKLLAQGSCLAVTGAPGCGKSTILKHVAYTLAHAWLTKRPQLAENELGLTGELPLPILIPLNLYAEHQSKKELDANQKKLENFIAEYLYQRQSNLPKNFFDMLLERQQSIILLLDGLDEVPTELERVKISKAITDLTLWSPNFSFVVTCRTYAYQGRAVLEGEFREIQVLPLAKAQVKRLIQQTYSAIPAKNLSPEERKTRSDALFLGVTRLEEERVKRLGANQTERLVTTPLLVRMLVIIHYNNRSLPDQRAELYRDVIQTILKSDYHPEPGVIEKLAEFEGNWKHRLQLLQYLAYTMHSQGRKAGREIKEDKLSEVLVEYLTNQRGKSLETAEDQVAKLMEMSRQRGGLLEEKAQRYRFSHLSFQEFLTARYVAEKFRSAERIAEFMLAERRIADSWWREPLLLTVGYLNIDEDEIAPELIERLAGSGNSDNDLSSKPSDNYLSLAAAELATNAFLEWGEGESKIQARLARRLAVLLSNPGITDAPPTLRAEAGHILARLGDPRPGVTTLPPLLTEKWLEGEFLYGEDKQKRVIKQRFKAGIYPITNAQYREFVTARGYDTLEWWSDEGGKAWLQQYEEKQPRYWDDPNFNQPNQPVVGVSYYEAEAFCSWLTRQMRDAGEIEPEEVVRLPTEEEWERLARGTQGHEYPWGNEWQEGQANTAESGIGRTCAVGLFPGGISPEKVLDCAGNVWEWCADWYDKKDNLRVLRGGSWSINRVNARCAARNRDDPYNGSDDVGFRVVVSSISPPPLPSGTLPSESLAEKEENH